MKSLASGMQNELFLMFPLRMCIRMAGVDRRRLITRIDALRPETDGWRYFREMDT